MDLYKVLNEQVTLEYIEKFLPHIKVSKRGKAVTFHCVMCERGVSAHFVPNSGAKISCLACNSKYNLFDIIRKVEADKKELSDDSLIEYVSKLFNINISSESAVDFLFDLYSNYGFSLVPLIAGDKIPIEQQWTTTEHKDKEDWKDWVHNKNLNVGIKCGSSSNVTVIDIDTEKIPEEFKDINTFISKTKRGYHYYFKYDPQLTNLDLRKHKIYIEILSDGRQAVIPPSFVDGFKRTWHNDLNIIEIPPDLKKWLMKFYEGKVPREDLVAPAYDKVADSYNPITSSEVMRMGEGSGRNNFLVHLGGILKSDLSMKQIGKVLELINNKFFDPPLHEKEFKNLYYSLDKYLKFDEKDLASKILTHLKLIEFANAKELTESLHERKDLIEKALSFLVINDLIYKKGRNYFAVPKIEWKTNLIDNCKKLPFKVPYFEDVANLYYQDHIIVGSQPKKGKSTLVMNIIKRLVMQGVQPFYYSSESGSRFKTTAIKLGLKEGDFKYTQFYEPESLVFEENGIHLVDWILFRDYASADKTMELIKNKIIKANAFAIIVFQLKPDDDWFSRNMVKFFPALAVRYLYEDDKGVSGYFQIDTIRDPKMHIKEWKIPCKYDFETRELTEVTPEEVQNL